MADASAPATAELATTAGAVCSAEASGVEVVGEFAPGRAHTATLGVAGFYDASGLRLDLVDPCGDAGCTRDFTCADGEETTVAFELTILRDVNQGFFELTIEPLADEPLSDVCYAVRVRNGAGEQVWSRTDLCSSEHGDDAGSVTYAGPCDAEQPDHDVTVWVMEITSDETTYTNPCPPPLDSAGGGEAAPEIGDWTGGCELAAKCVESDDVTVRFDLSFPPAR